MHCNSEEMVSVVIPVYNQEDYLSDCLKSLLNQTCRDLEILVIDDGSTDRSFEIAAAFAREDSRIRLIRKENGGVSSARNTGIENASGKYIAFVDADDVISGHYIEYLLHALRTTGLSMAMCACEMVTEGAAAREWVSEAPCVRQMDIFEEYDYGASFALRHVWGALFYLEDAKKFRFDTGLSVGEDSLYVAQMVAAHRRIAMVQQVLYRYVIHEKTLSHGAFDEKKATAFAAWEKIAAVYAAGCPRLVGGCYVSLAREILDAADRILYENGKPRREYDAGLYRMCTAAARRNLKNVLRSGWRRKARLLFVLFCVSPRCYFMWQYSKKTKTRGV